MGSLSTGLPAARYPSNASSTPTCSPDDVSAQRIRRFDQALQGKDHASLKQLFFDESHWRDHLMLTWAFRTLKGPLAIVNYLLDTPKTFVRLTVRQDHPPKLGPVDKFGKLHGVLSLLQVETDSGLGQGYVRLLQDSNDGTWKAFTFFTSLRQIKGYHECIKFARPSGLSHTRHYRSEAGTNGDSVSNSPEDPAVLIIGAGQAGLTTAVRLSQFGISNIVIDKNRRIGDGWRNRYRGFVLHDPLWYNHLPYMPFPDTWPVFTPKDKLANWFEVYAQALDLNVWVSTEVKHAEWRNDHWRVELLIRFPDGSVDPRILHPRHLVQATGHSGPLSMPSIEGTESFRGSKICHSSEFVGTERCGNGEKVVVIGSGNSAHDIAQDYCLNGFDVTMIQRSATCVDPTNYAKGKDLYKEDGALTEDADFITQSLPSALSKRLQIEGTAQLHRDFDAFFVDLHKAGFATDRGPDGAGRKLKYLETGGGYYIDVGASSLIIDGRIKIRQGFDVRRIEPHAVVLTDGSELPAEQIIFATGFKDMRETSRQIFGNKVANKLTEVWGLDSKGELRSVWCQSGHPGLWLAGGNLAIARYFSRLLALQILACEIGLLKRESDVDCYS